MQACRDRHRHEPLPHRRPSRVLGQVRAHRQQLRREEESGSTGKGNPWLGATLGEIAAVTSRSNTFLGERYRRLSKRRGRKRAIVAVGNSVLTIVWHLLSDPDARYHDLGADFYQSRIATRRRERDLVRRLERLTGKTVTLQPAA